MRQLKMKRNSMVGIIVSVGFIVSMVANTGAAYNRGNNYRPANDSPETAGRLVGMMGQTGLALNTGKADGSLAKKKTPDSEEADIGDTNSLVGQASPKDEGSPQGNESVEKQSQDVGEQVEDNGEAVVVFPKEKSLEHSSPKKADAKGRAAKASAIQTASSNIGVDKIASGKTELDKPTESNSAGTGGSGDSKETAEVNLDQYDAVPSSDLLRHHLLVVSHMALMPVGGSYRFAGGLSFRGISLAYRYRFVKNFSINMMIAWTAASTEKKGLTDFNGFSVYSNQYRWLQVVPIRILGEYYFKTHSNAQPFMGFGVGVYNVTRYTDYGFFSGTQEDWHFGMSPNVGVLLPFDTVGISISADFHCLPQSGNDSELFVTSNIGLVLLK